MGGVDAGFAGKPRARVRRAVCVCKVCKGRGWTRCRAQQRSPARRPRRLTGARARCRAQQANTVGADAVSCTTEVTETCAATAAPHRHAKAQYVRVRLRAPGVPNSTRAPSPRGGNALSIVKNELENRRTASFFSSGTGRDTHHRHETSYKSLRPDATPLDCLQAFSRKREGLRN